MGFNIKNLVINIKNQLICPFCAVYTCDSLTRQNTYGEHFI